MTLTSGELSGLSGCFLIMTATATMKTRRLLLSQIPEVHNWRNLLSPPLRDNVLLVIPPPEMLSSNLSVLLTPFVEDMIQNNKIYLVLVRGINKGSEVFLFMLKHLSPCLKSDRSVAFFHGNTKEERKAEILQDLKLDLNNLDKKYRCVVATVSLGSFHFIISN